MKANYYAHLGSPHLLNAVESNDDTVNLSDDSGTVLVTKCPLSDEPKVGHAVLIKDKAPPAADPGKTGKTGK